MQDVPQQEESPVEALADMAKAHMSASHRMRCAMVYAISACDSHVNLCCGALINLVPGDASQLAGQLTLLRNDARTLIANIDMLLSPNTTIEGEVLQ